jgi:hypothetical protein
LLACMSAIVVLQGAGVLRILGWERKVAFTDVRPRMNSNQLYNKETTYFLNIPRNVLNFELSSGTFSATAAVEGAVVREVSVGTELVVEGAGEGMFSEESDDDIAMGVF